MKEAYFLLFLLSGISAFNLIAMEYPEDIVPAISQSSINEHINTIDNQLTEIADQLDDVLQQYFKKLHTIKTAWFLGFDEKRALSAQQKTLHDQQEEIEIKKAQAEFKSQKKALKEKLIKVFQQYRHIQNSLMSRTLDKQYPQDYKNFLDLEAQFKTLNGRLS